MTSISKPSPNEAAEEDKKSKGSFVYPGLPTTFRANRSLFCRVGYFDRPNRSNG